jgi:hypothetical protein
MVGDCAAGGMEPSATGRRRAAGGVNRRQSLGMDLKAQPALYLQVGPRAETINRNWWRSPSQRSRKALPSAWSSAAE